MVFPEMKRFERHRVYAERNRVPPSWERSQRRFKQIEIYRRRNRLPDPNMHYIDYRGRFITSFIDAFWGPCGTGGTSMVEALGL